MPCSTGHRGLVEERGTGEPSAALLHFVRQHITSVEILEVLLLLWRHPERAWDPGGVAADLRIQPRSAGLRLAALEKLGLCKSAPPRYSFNAASPLAPLVDELDRAYQTHRVRLIELIFSTPNDNARVFADAFVLGKAGKPDG